MFSNTSRGRGSFFFVFFFAQPLLLGPTEWAGYIAVHVCVWKGPFLGGGLFRLLISTTTLLLLRRQGSLLS